MVNIFRYNKSFGLIRYSDGSLGDSSCIPLTLVTSCSIVISRVLLHEYNSSDNEIKYKAVDFIVNFFYIKDLVYELFKIIFYWPFLSNITFTVFSIMIKSNRNDQLSM